MTEIPFGNIYLSTQKWVDGDILTWYNFDSYDWDGFTNAEYNSFSFVYSSVPDTTNINRLNVVFTNSTNYNYIQYIYLGGFPITCYQNINSNDIILPVIIDANFNYSDKELIFNGNPIQLGENGNKYCLFVNNTKRSNIKHDSENTFYLEGIPLSVNEHNDLILKHIEGSSQREETIFIGNQPIIIRQINNNWFIVVTL